MAETTTKDKRDELYQKINEPDEPLSMNSSPVVWPSVSQVTSPIVSPSTHIIGRGTEQSPREGTAAIGQRLGGTIGGPGVIGAPQIGSQSPADNSRTINGPSRFARVGHILGEIGRDAGSAIGQVAAPWAMPFIPGTIQHDWLKNSEAERVERDKERQAQSEASVKHTGAETDLEEAQAKKLGEPAKPEKPDVMAEEGGGLVSVERDASGKVIAKPVTEEAQAPPDLGTERVTPQLMGPPAEGFGSEQVKLATKPTATEKMESREVMGPDGKSMMANFHPDTGKYTDQSGKEIANVQPVVKEPAEKTDQMSLWLKAHPDKNIDDYMKLEANLKPEFPRILPVNDPQGNTTGFAEFTGTAGGIKSNFTPVGTIPGLGAATGAEGQPGQAVIPPKPTSAVLTQSQRAQMIQPQVQALKSQIEKTKDSLGPLSGRWNEVMTGKIGADNPEVARLQMQLKLFSTALMLAHGLKGETYEKGLNEYLNLSQSPANLQARIDGANSYLEDYAKSTGHGGKEAASGGGISVKAPAGADNDVLVGGKLVGHTVNGKYVPIGR